MSGITFRQSHRSKKFTKIMNPGTHSKYTRDKLVLKRLPQPPPFLLLLVPTYSPDSKKKLNITQQLTSVKIMHRWKYYIVNDHTLLFGYDES